MFNLWSKILKQKGIVSFTLLFFIIVGILLPNVALGFSIDSSSWTCEVTSSGGNSDIINFGNDPESPGYNALKEFFSSIYNNPLVQYSPPVLLIQGTGAALNYINPIKCFDYYIAYAIAGVGSLLIQTSQFIANIFGDLYNLVARELIKDIKGNWAITTSTGYAGSAFYDSWSITKNWANMLIVLGLIGVALAFILNLDQYKKLLAPLLMVALLVNFSVVFVGLMIDTSNIVTKTFIGSGEQQHNVTFKINEIWNKTLYKYPINKFGDSIEYFGLSVLFSIVYITLGVTLLMLAIIFIERYVILAILFILSPLAFVFYVFPLKQAKELFSSWWNHFIKWCFVGLIGAFFVNLSSQILEKFSGFFVADATTNTTKIIGSLSQVFFYLLIVVIFLVAGMVLTFQASGRASKMVIAGAVTTGTFLAAGGAALARGAVRTAGGERAWNAARERVSAGLERVGLRQGGATRAMIQRRAAAITPQEKEQVDNMTPQQLMSHARGTATRLGMSTESAMRIKAAATAMAFEKGFMNNLPPQEQERHAQYAIATDKNYAKSIAKGNPLLAHLDPDKMAELRAKNPQLINPDQQAINNVAQTIAGGGNPINNTHRTLARAQIVAEGEERLRTMAHREAYARMPEDKELLKLNDQEKIERIITSAGGIDPATGRLRGNVAPREAQLIESMAEKGTLGKLSAALEGLAASAGHTVNGIQEASRQMNSMANNLGSTVFKDAKEKDPRFADKDSQAIEERAQKIAGLGNPITAVHRAAARHNLRDEAYGKLTSRDIARKLHESVIDIDFVRNEKITSEKLNKVGQDAQLTDNMKKAFKDLLPKIAHEENNARMAGLIPEANELENKFFSILAWK